MKPRWEQFKWKLAAWASGRYGQDKLSKHLLWFSIAMWIFSFFLATSPWRLLPLTLGWLALLFSCFRTFSRNLYARQKELGFYEKHTETPRRFFKLQKNRWRDRKTHRYFRCSCGAVLRVPRQKGEIVVKCPKCGAKRNKKT